MITYRWIDGPTATDSEWEAIDKILESQRWIALNRATSRIFVAEDEGVIIGFNTIQFVPYVGPLYVDPKYRAGEAVTMLTNDMEKFLVDNRARGWFSIAMNRHSEKICEDHGMTKVQYPLYVMVGMERPN